MSKKRALGRGLDAILSSPDTDITSEDISGNYVVGAVAEIKVEQIETNPFQPRTDFDEEALQALAMSIKKQGIIQPITVRKMGLDRYQLISGERRFRASQKAGLQVIPAYIRVANDEQMLEMALVENIQRENLNAIEIAISYQRLLDECDITQDELSKRVGKNRSTITNYVRLLKLPAELQIALRTQQIGMGHARALINVTDPLLQLQILEKILLNNLSVREVERMVSEQAQPKSKKVNTNVLSAPYQQYEKRLNNYLGEKVKLQISKNGKGKIVIPFASEEALQRILSQIDKQN